MGAKRDRHFGAGWPPRALASRGGLLTLLAAAALLVTATLVLPCRLAPLLPGASNTAPVSAEGRVGLEVPAWEWAVAHHAYDPLRRAQLMDCRRDLFPFGAWFHGDAWRDSGETESQPEGSGAGGSLLAAKKPKGSILFGTQYAQEYLWKWQHPENCADKKFFVHTAHDGGIGSQIHMIGAAMATAMKMGRIYILTYAEGVTVYTEGDYCKKRSAMDKCFFEPISGCTPKDAGFDLKNHSDIVEFNHDNDLSEHRTIRAFANTWGDEQDFPPQFEPLMEFSGLRGNKRLYWYRAQASAYLVRPNKRTRAHLDKRRLQIFGNRTLTPGSISVHVRHGDKRTEEDLVGDDTYWRKAQALQADPMNGLARSIFLSTYDPATVAYFKNATERAGWELAFTDVPRLDDDPDMTTRLYAETIGPATEMLNSLVNLDLALQCSAWIGTLSSNWCRLIEELRATVGCAAHLPYLDPVQDFPYNYLGGP